MTRPPRTRPTPIAAFADPDAVPGPLPARATAALLAAVGDVALVLDARGTILDAAVSSADLSHHGFTAWVGEPWSDTVTVESRPKVAEMLAAAADATAAPRWRQVNHPAAGGDVPVRYLTMPLGADDRLVAIGRDMRAVAAQQQRLLQTQQSLERDYVRLRQAETRYRLLFDGAAEPMLIADAKTRRIREANPAMHRLLGTDDGSLVGGAVAGIVDERDRDDLVAHLGAAGASDEQGPVTLRLDRRRGGASFTASLFRQGQANLILLRATPVLPGDHDHARDGTLEAVIERMPDGFVLADRDLTVLATNAAFVELVELPSADRIIGTPLGGWLGRPGIDLDLIVGQLREHGTVRNLATVLNGAAGGEEEVEVSAVAAPAGDRTCYGFTVRGVARRLRPTPAVDRDMPRSVEQLTELVGRVSLKEIVRESADLIERLCIEAALAYTSDNRASAAEVLGVSRQSLYSKLHRYGLGNLVSPGD